MRLVSAIFKDYYPFYGFHFINETISSNNPTTLKKDDVLVVWGGADIWHGYYNKEKSRYNYCDSTPSWRDAIEWAMMQRAKELGIPIIGVCRGAQMLCALAGGYLMQHVTGHGGTHNVITHTGETYETNSIHHQMMVPGPAKHEVLAQINPKALLSSVYWDENTEVDHQQEPEFIYFNDVNGYAIQWHPEMMGPNCAATHHIEQEMEKRLCLPQV